MNNTYIKKILIEKYNEQTHSEEVVSSALENCVFKKIKYKRHLIVFNEIEQRTKIEIYKHLIIIDFAMYYNILSNIHSNKLNIFSIIWKVLSTHKIVMKGRKTNPQTCELALFVMVDENGDFKSR